MNEHMVTMDPPAHTRERALLMRLITPRRLKENEAFMYRLSDQLLDEFVTDGPVSSSVPTRSRSQCWWSQTFSVCPSPTISASVRASV